MAKLTALAGKRCAVTIRATGAGIPPAVAACTQIGRLHSHASAAALHNVNLCRRGCGVAVAKRDVLAGDSMGAFIARRMQ